MRLRRARTVGVAYWRALLVLVVAALTALVLAAWLLRDALSLPAHTQAGPVLFEVAAGASFGRVARQLEALDGGYPYPRLLTWYARWRGDAQRIKAGEYRLPPAQSLDAFIALLVSGKVVQYQVTAIEGWTFRQFRAELARHPKLTQSQVDRDADEIMAALGYPGQHPEGRFFPDTYSFVKGTTDLALLARAHAAMAQRLAAAWAARDDDLPLTEPQQALTLASIIEKETARDDERRKIAGVFVRRLRRGMRLQTDPTVIYGLGPGFNGNLTRRDLRSDTPYNTYTRGGLPPTPIALPGQASLDAAVHPEAGDSLYFVATGEADGSHYFSATLAEHQLAVKRYLERLRRSP